MKPLFAILAITVTTHLGKSQGTVLINNGNANFLITTNNFGLGSAQFGNLGVTTKSPGSFYYALLVADYGGSVPNGNPLNAAWSDAVLTGVNFAVTAGGIQGQGGYNGAATPAGTWGAPVDGNISSGVEKYFILVGWSANMGTNWATVKGELNSFSLTPGDLFGYSAIGYGFAGGGPFNLNAPSIWGVSGAMPGGLTSGFTLNGLFIPEPSTPALAGLGGLALLAFRRKQA